MIFLHKEGKRENRFNILSLKERDIDRKRETERETDRRERETSRNCG
jgi:hypothetical protein